MLLSGSGYSPWVVGTAPPDGGVVVGAAAPKTAPPTVAHPITVNNNAPVTGTSALLSVLGSDAAGESSLIYTWSVTAAPSGGKATFSLNGKNSAKNTAISFNEAGTYGVGVTIKDPAGLTVSTTASVVVTPTLTYFTIARLGGTGDVKGATVQFSASQCQDQFHNALAGTPALTWAATSRPAGAAAPTFTASGNVTTVTFAMAGSYTLTAHSAAAVSGTGSVFTTTLKVDMQSSPPTVAQAITVNSNAPVTGTTATLSVLGSDPQGQSMTYTWSVTAEPGGGTATFSPNGSTAANDTTVTCTEAGTYGVAVTIKDTAGLTVSTTASVVVTPTLTYFTIARLGGTGDVKGTTVQFSASQCEDQFHNAMSGTPALTWAAPSLPVGAAAPTFTASGNVTTVTFAAPGSYTLTARSATAAGGTGSVFTTTLKVDPQNSPPTVAQAITVNNNAPVTGTTATLSVLGSDPQGQSMTYTWSVTAEPSGGTATFSPNGSTAANDTTVTCTEAGTYGVAVTIEDAAGLSVSTTANVVVTPTLTSIVLSPNAASVLVGATQQFNPLALDQFGQALANQPVFAWSASAGTVSGSGMFTAAGTAGTCTVTAASGSLTGTATVTILANPAGLQDPALAALVAKLDADGSISRQDMIQILDAVDADGPLSATDFSDLQAILSHAATLNIPGYVQVLASDVIDGNPANATYQGQTLGNLAVGSSAAQLTDLIDKWFYGTDLPTLCDSSLVYQQTAGSLFPHTPSHNDEYQGELGDCYFISALGTLADSNPAAVENMFINNGDGTYTVRFYFGTYGVINSGSGGISAGFQNNQITADYVTVNTMLPTSGGQLVYADYGANANNAGNSLWIPLAEKAYAQWNQSGREGRDGTNAYASIQGGWMATVDAQVLGYNATDYLMSGTGEQTAINALAAHDAVTIGTLNWSGTQDGLYADHAYAIIGYNAASDTFILYNPWGMDQPGPLTWSQLQADCSQLAVADASGSVPIGASQDSTAVHASQLRAAGPAHGMLSARLVDAMFAARGWRRW
jgi:hypothetical protein